MLLTYVCAKVSAFAVFHSENLYNNAILFNRHFSSPWRILSTVSHSEMLPTESFRRSDCILRPDSTTPTRTKPRKSLRTCLQPDKKTILVETERTRSTTEQRPEEFCDLSVTIGDRAGRRIPSLRQVRLVELVLYGTRTRLPYIAICSGRYNK